MHGNDAITVSEKLKGVIAPLIMDENNANLHRERKSKQPKLHITDQKFALVCLCRAQVLDCMLDILKE